LTLECLPQFLVSCDPTSYEQRSHIVGCGRGQSLSNQVFNDCTLERGDEIKRARVTVREIVVEVWFGDRCQGSSPGVDVGMHQVCLEVGEYRRFDREGGEIEARTVVVRIDCPSVISAAPISMLDLSRGKLYGVRVPVGREAVD